MSVTFHGVRGSTPCQGEEIARYGGNTSCVEVDVPGHDPILFDIGTGARYFGLALPNDRPFRGTCLLSHFHWDHIQGLPFFTPLLRADSHLDIYTPEQQDGRSSEQLLESTLCPPLFPVGIGDFPGVVSFRSVGDADFRLGEVDVSSRFVPHLGNTLGYRLEWGGAVVTYLSDHQQPGIDVYEATPAARWLCEGADLLIHDAQYTREEFERKPDWGHCTIEYATWLAQECGVKALALFHHDPSHSDDQLDRIVAIEDERVGPGLRVIGAREGLTIQLGE